MPKALPPAAIDALSPPPTVFPYTFFEHVDQHPFKADAYGLNLRNAWWLMDAAFLSYSSEADIRQVFQQPLFGSPVAVRFFSDPRSTQCYVASSDDWIVLAFRGTQVDDFWASVIDSSVDARFVPIADSHGDAVHAGFLSAAQDVWPAVAGHLRTL